MLTRASFSRSGTSVAAARAVSARSVGEESSSSASSSASRLVAVNAAGWSRGSAAANASWPTGAAAATARSTPTSAAVAASSSATSAAARRSSGVVVAVAKSTIDRAVGPEHHRVGRQSPVRDARGVQRRDVLPQREQRGVGDRRAGLAEARPGHGSRRHEREAAVGRARCEQRRDRDARGRGAEQREPLVLHLLAAGDEQHRVLVAVRDPPPGPGEELAVHLVAAETGHVERAAVVGADERAAPGRLVLGAVEGRRRSRRAGASASRTDATDGRDIGTPNARCTAAAAAQPSTIAPSRSPGSAVARNRAATVRSPTVDLADASHRSGQMRRRHDDRRGHDRDPGQREARRRARLRQRVECVTEADPRQRGAEQPGGDPREDARRRRCRVRAASVDPPAARPPPARSPTARPACRGPTAARGARRAARRRTAPATARPRSRARRAAPARRTPRRRRRCATTSLTRRTDRSGSRCEQSSTPAPETTVGCPRPQPRTPGARGYSCPVRTRWFVANQPGIAGT